MKPIDLFLICALLFFYNIFLKFVELKGMEYPLLQLIMELIIILLVLVLPNYKNSLLNLLYLNKQKKIDDYFKK